MASDSDEGQPFALPPANAAYGTGENYSSDPEAAWNAKQQKIDRTLSVLGQTRYYVVKGLDDLQERFGLWSPGKLAVIAVLYLTLGTLCGLFSGWSAIDSLYFTVTTFSTVGYGDILPSSKRWFNRVGSAIFVLLSVFVIGTTFGLLLDSVLEEQNAAVEAATVEAERKQADSSSSGSDRPTKDPSTGTLLRRSEETLGRAQLIYRESRNRLSDNLRWNGMMLAGIILLGPLVGLLEGWDWAKSFYWSCVTISTVGYGDVTPQTPAGRLLATALMLYGVFVVAHCIAAMLSYRHQIREVRLREKVLLQFGAEFTVEKYHTLAHGGEVHDLGLCSFEKNITRSEFCLYMLVKMNRVSKEELQSCQDAFDSLDSGGDGYLDLKDVDIHKKMTEHARSQNS